MNLFKKIPDKYYMAVSFRNIERLRAGEINLQPWPKDKGAPNESNDLLRMIVNYARAHKLPAIPKETVDRLRTDPDFKYCFIVSVTHHTLYSKEDYGHEERALLKRAIENPETITAREIMSGIKYHMNNFINNLPGGAYWYYFNNFGLTGYEKKLRHVEELLQTDGRREKFQRLKAEALREEEEYKKTLPNLENIPPDAAVKNRNFSRRLQYYKFVLELFNAMIEKYGYTADELWA